MKKRGMILGYNQCSKSSRHENLSIFITIQDYYEQPKKTIRVSGNIYHNFKPNNYKDVQSLYQNKASMDMSLNEFKYLTLTCWDKKHQPIPFDNTKDKYTGRYQLGLISLFVLDTNPFKSF